jgi:hypothetical protein
VRAFVDFLARRLVLHPVAPSRIGGVNCSDMSQGR